MQYHDFRSPQDPDGDVAGGYAFANKHLFSVILEKTMIVLCTLFISKYSPQPRRQSDLSHVGVRSQHQHFFILVNMVKRQRVVVKGISGPRSLSGTKFLSLTKGAKVSRSILAIQMCPPSRLIFFTSFRKNRTLCWQVGFPLPASWEKGQHFREWL